MKTTSVIVAAISLTITLCLNYARATDNINHRLRLIAVKHNMTCVLVFGDSSVDPGNNNRFSTPAKSNFLPYGKDFLINGRPSGRFCNGRLATDFIAEAFGYTDSVRAFLDPAITKEDLLHGVSFASSGSGYDELTANISSVLSISKQLEYLRHYKIHLKNLVGTKESEKIVENAIFILSMGSNDFLQNYYIEPTRSHQYTVEQYVTYLISCMRNAIKGMNSLGARTVVVVGVPPLGCMPLVRMLRGDTKCNSELNRVAFLFNSEIQRELKTMERSNNSSSRKSVFLDIYSIILNAVENPTKYGFTEPLKGCCGSGTYEYADTCKGLSTCSDRTKYIFWDAVHLTEKMYKIVADAAVELLIGHIFLSTTQKNKTPTT